MKANVIRQLGCNSDVAGLLAGNLIWLVGVYHFPMIAQPAWLLAALVFIGCIAGFYIGATAAFNGVEPRKAVRDGVWAAGVAATVSMACFVLTFYGGSNPFIAIKALVGGALSVLPATFYGMFSAALAVLVISRPSSVGTVPRCDIGIGERVTRWSARVAVLALVACAIWTPFHPVLVATERTPPSRSRTEVQPAEPDFKYSAPDQIAIAEALQWKLVARRAFSGIAASPIAFSHDERWLAVTPVGGQTIRILDLNSSAPKPDVVPPGVLSRFAFAPDGKRLFTLSSDAPSKIGVIDIDTARFIALPKPKGRELPQGSIRWWQDQEVLFLPAGGEKRILDLDTLEMDDASDVATWKSVGQSKRDAVVDAVAGGLSSSPRWKWETGSVLMATEPPEIVGGSEWANKRESLLRLRHPERDSELVFPTINAQSNDLWRVTQDGSKVLRFREGTLDIFYFGIVPIPKMKWSVTMPHAPDEGKVADDLGLSLRSGTLRAIVYAPLINPLTGAVVGPNRSIVKAVLGFAEWNTTNATLYLAQQIQPITEGDIIADVAAADGQSLHFLELLTAHRWWAKLGEPEADSDTLGGVPRLEEIKQMAAREKAAADKKKAALAEQKERERIAKLEAEKKALEAKLKAENEAEEKAREARELAEKKAAFMAELNARRGGGPPQQNGIDDKVRAFVRAHHFKAQQGDVPGIVADYGDRVDHFNNGLVDRNFIFNDESRYHANNSILEESVSDDIRVEKRGTAGYKVTYTIEVQTLNVRTNQTSGGKFDVELLVVETPTGLKITRQQTKKKP